MDITAFEDRLRNQEKPAILDIWAPWCLPCRKMAPDLDRLEEVYSGQVNVWRLNVDAHPDLARRLRVLAVPTLIVYRDGKEVLRRTGAQRGQALEALFDFALGTRDHVSTVLASEDRILRLLAGFGLVAIGWAAGPSFLLLTAGGLVLFSAVYDRCPVWKAIVQRVWAVRAGS